MITITPIELATLIAEGKPIELVDVRSTKEFEEIHIPRARSAPLGKLSAAKVVRDRKLAATEPLYVIYRSRRLAGLAAGMLQASGCIHPVVVEGGMDTWAAQAARHSPLSTPAGRPPRANLG